MRTPPLKFLTYLLLFLAGVGPLCRAQVQLVGDWGGTESIYGQNIHVLLHVTEAADGRITSAWDNVDQGVYGIKAKSITLNGDDLTIMVDDMVLVNGQNARVVAVYRGKVNKGNSEVTGTIKQTQPEEQPATELNFTREITFDDDEP